MPDQRQQQPVAVDSRALGAERAARAQAAMKKAGLASALLFDPANVRYVTCDGQFLVATLHCSYRWALLFAEHDPILWDGEDQVHLSRSRWDGDIRSASSFTFFGSGPNSRRDAARAIGEVVDALVVRGLQHEPLGVDRVEARPRTSSGCS
jgi:Xaa-Pro dipeptidase